MKLMYCEACGHLIVPSYIDMVPTYCTCRRHAVWWRNGGLGLISVFDRERPKQPMSTEEADQWQPKAFIIGITNSFLLYPKEFMTGADIEEIIDDHDDSYLFKQHRSCIIRVRPGHSRDSQWDEIPGN